MNAVKMSLEKACYVLAKTHTRDDAIAGYIVEMGGPSGTYFTRAEYIEAWRIIRETAHLPVEADEGR